ncbi:MAG: hypothetical protein A3D64_03025 [Candidatus Wildermuthbacteria bacterium RIFCSPHIGHO2_02_FULL_49_9]|uniref:Uncharacterized protein n=2 Tax=Candidatus Wildermuthiibacteriota TaxID=1817923 RepID=A0A1G2QVW6_9BACT|nr:MAG: hypothetical protein A2672_02125 [Candidatus Wildermuthbacteria bacterium RIFCSPHIGHO2_01_FULL_49_22b]OHA71099.1 MAG: hypothetical protein A3D64_03025 [Candidatus Wildermuthbacteria bacterium RIFCSPHIGHO2_02_FULL_49_9]
MTPRTQFEKLRVELLEKGELVLKTIMHNGEEESSLKLIVKVQRWLVEEIAAIEGVQISRRTKTISKRRAENLIWANLPPTQPKEEERT